MNAGLAKQAVLAAAQLRAKHGIGPAEGLCPYDLAIALEIKVSFLDAPSLEGMYSPQPTPASIILSSLRPPGRRRYTCAHEIGHHVFGHGYRIDQLEENDSSPTDPEEQLAQRFASALLMPKIAVDASFSKRKWDPKAASAEQIYSVAQEFGVGFTTLINNLQLNLHYLSKKSAEGLCNVNLEKVRESLAGEQAMGEVFLIDQSWGRRTIDLEVDDLIVLGQGLSLNTSLVRQTGPLRLIASSPGTAQIVLGAKLPPITLRVSRREYTGLARYRHLEEVADGD